jgi:hypothetical protein
MYSLDSSTYGDRYPSQQGNSYPNYQDYSHAGKNLGPDLEPNSDRISLRTTWRTLPNFDLSFSAYFSRHGNASENRIADDAMDGTYHDGSIFDDGNNDGTFNTTHGTAGDYDNNYRYLRFLIQPNLETKLAGGIGLSWHLPTGFGAFSLNAEYTLEYGWNRNCIAGNNSPIHYWSVGGSFRY